MILRMRSFLAPAVLASPTVILESINERSSVENPATVVRFFPSTPKDTKSYQVLSGAYRLGLALRRDL